MDLLLNAIDLKQLGLSGVLLGYVLYQNHILRQDLKEEREYSRNRDKSSVEDMRAITQVLALLSERIKP